MTEKNNAITLKNYNMSTSDNAPIAADQAQRDMRVAVDRKSVV